MVLCVCACVVLLLPGSDVEPDLSVCRVVRSTLNDAVCNDDRISPRTIKYRAREELWEHFFHRENVAHSLRRRIRNYEMYMYREPLGNLPRFARYRRCSPCMY